MSVTLEGMSLFLAWEQWATKPLPADGVVLGLKVFVWSRIGKVMQFLGAATILLEIIGPARVREFGASIANASTLKRLQRFRQKPGLLCRAWWMLVVGDGDERQIARHTLNELNAERPLALLYLLWPVLYLLWGWERFPILLQLVHIVGGTLLLYLILAKIAEPIAVLLALLLNTLLSATGAATNAVAWTMEHPRLEKWVRVGAFFALVVGFHFDLLAS